MKPSYTNIHPYNSAPVKITGTALNSIGFKNRVVPAEFYISPGSCNSILNSNKAQQLKIASLEEDDNHIFKPVLMISSQEKDGEFIKNVVPTQNQYLQKFMGLGKF